MIKVKKLQRKNPQQPDVIKWHLTQEKAGTVGIRDIANEIKGRSALSLGDVLSVVNNIAEVIALYLKLGQTVKIDGLGSFHLSVTSQGTETAEELNAHHVKAVKLIFIPSQELKRFLSDITFEIA